MQDTRGVVVSRSIYITIVGLVLWMTIPIGLKGLLTYGSGTSASLLAMGVATGILAVIPAVRKRVWGRRLPKANAMIIAGILILVGILEAVKLADLRTFAVYGLAFEVVDKLVLIGLLGLASFQLVVGALRSNS